MTENTLTRVIENAAYHAGQNNLQHLADLIERMEAAADADPSNEMLDEFLTRLITWVRNMEMKGLHDANCEMLQRVIRAQRIISPELVELVSKFAADFRRITERAP